MTTIPPRSELKWVGIDLDGTLAEPIWTPENPTDEIGKPIPRNIYKLFDLVSAGYKPTIHTSRPWHDHERVEAWLKEYSLDLAVQSIQCGKPLFALYIDDRGRHESEESWIP